MKENRSDLVDLENFISQVVRGYQEGWGPDKLPADLFYGRSFIPAGTGAYRDFSYIGTELPELIPENCTGCLDCVTQCPDTAILAKVINEKTVNDKLSQVEDQPLDALHHGGAAGATHQTHIKKQWVRTKKYYDAFQKKGVEPGMFGLFTDPSKCKGCGECVTVCDERGTKALRMIKKDEDTLALYRKAFEFFKNVGETPAEYVIERSLHDMMLADKSLLYVGGAGSCTGCGEATALRMMLAATGFVYGKDSVALICATGCNTVYGSTYPYNPFLVPWTNSLFENPAVVAMGVRMAWDRLGWKQKRIWAIGGDGAMFDIGFQPLSRMLASGMDVKALVLDTQVYSNTGGQMSGSTFLGQATKFSHIGAKIKGKTEKRKELAQICMMHPDSFVAQTTCYHITHFYKSVMAANEFAGPAVIIVYSACQPEHGIADNLSASQARLAVYSRAFPLLIYDPRKGSSIKERLSLWGNPSEKADWTTNPKTGETINFITFARTEGRFAKHFDKAGKPSPELLASQEDRLQNWRQLQELAGLR